MTDRELMQQALDLLDDINQCSLPPTGIPLPAEIDHVMQDLRARLAQPEQEIESDRDHVEDDGCPTEKAVLQRFWREHQKQEPDYEAEFIKDWNEGKVRRVSDGKRMVPQREWQGMTDEDIEQIHYGIKCKGIGAYSTNDIYRAIEAKLKEKNT